jgi:hypothetical protein
MPQRTTKHCFAVMTLFVFLSVMLIAADATAQTYNLLVKVKGVGAANREVNIAITQAGSSAPIYQKPTGLFGYAFFTNVPGGNYTVTPSKPGYSYNPEFKLATFTTGANRNIFIRFEGASISDIWSKSGHADSESEAFVHWDEDDPAEIPTSCAKCHSTPGILDFLGDDGTAAGVVDNPVPAGEGVSNNINCAACHNGTAVNSVKFPSGAVLSNLGTEAICMQCHQGRSSTPQVDAAIAKAAPADDDTPTSDLSFQNIHYFAAAATLYGGEVQGGYEYAGKAYDIKFQHVEGYDKCFSCHDQHSLRVKTEYCVQCHPGATEVDDLKNVRMNGSLMDYDGDGNITEGIAFEIEGLQAKLYQAIQAYASTVAGKKIAYNTATHPYFFIDTNGNGLADADETDRYDAFTARLVRAAYNYQTSLKDPGAYAHNAKYIIELLYDSIEDLNTKLSPPVSLSGASRVDEGHFDGSSEAFRHWDEEEEGVASGCVKCHTSYGLPKVLKGETLEAGPPSNGMSCSTCHENNVTFPVRQAGEVTFPSGLKASLEDASNLCMNCHQGRASKKTIDDNIAAGNFRFVNVHYYAAAASFFGTDVKGGYEYDGKTYAGKTAFPAHGGNLNTCVQCHMGTESANTSHMVIPKVANCQCHGISSFDALNISGSDYNKDGQQPVKQELESMQAALYSQIQDYGKKELEKPIVYSATAYPYFFNDTNGNGVLDAEESASDNGYQSFDENLLKAAYNYQFNLKEPCGYIHNADYMAQLAIDSIGDLGGAVSKFSRP